MKKSNFFLWIFSEKFFYSAEARTTQSHANIFDLRELLIDQIKTRTTQSHANIFLTSKEIQEIYHARTTQSHANIFGKSLYATNTNTILAQRNRMRIYSAKTTIELCAHGLIYVQLTLSSVSATDKIPALCILSRFSDVESPVKIMRTMLGNTINVRFAYFPILFL